MPQLRGEQQEEQKQFLKGNNGKLSAADYCPFTSTTIQLSFVENIALMATRIQAVFDSHFFDAV